MAQELDIPFVARLIEIAEAQTRSIIGDALRHAQAHMVVEADHPSMGVVAQELSERCAAAANSLAPQPPHEYEAKV